MGATRPGAASGGSAITSRPTVQRRRPHPRHSSAHDTTNRPFCLARRLVAGGLRRCFGAGRQAAQKLSAGRMRCSLVLRVCEPVRRQPGYYDVGAYILNPRNRSSANCKRAHVRVRCVYGMAAQSMGQSHARDHHAVYTR
jgi:hypothetical protein